MLLIYFIVSLVTTPGVFSYEFMAHAFRAWAIREQEKSRSVTYNMDLELDYLDNMALIGKVEEFQENDYWREYTERLGHFTANEITDAGKKRAVLLSSCGAKTYKLIRNLVSPGKPTDKNLR